MRRGLCVATLGCLQLSHPVEASAQDAAKQEFYIERKPIVEALKEFYRQTSPPIGFQYLPANAEEDKILVGPLNGEYTADAALTELLRPAGFSFVWINQRTVGIISPRTPIHRRP